MDDFSKLDVKTAESFIFISQEIDKIKEEQEKMASRKGKKWHK